MNNDIVFLPSKTNKKYVAKIPKQTWNKYRNDKTTQDFVLVPFGQKPYQHYNDKIGHYKHLNHLDKKRRDLYYKRFGRDAIIFSPKYFSHKYLW